MSEENVEIVRRVYDASLHGETERVIDDAGESVVVAHMMRGRGKESGVEVELPSTNVYTVHDGLVTAIHMYRDHGRALEVAGLSE
jgi:ketosteroid isomerase-like protein